jgi:predicted DNA-binding transcriptional regulator
LQLIGKRVTVELKITQRIFAVNAVNNELTSERRKSKKGAIVYRENPFWEPQEVKIGSKLIRIAGGRHISEEGESVSHSGIHQVKEVDETQFIKIYTQNIKSFFDIKPTTQKVLMAILNAIQKTPNADSIYLNWFEVDDYSKRHELQISERSFYNAMKELLEKGFVAESERINQYWINPHLFFNGNRMIFIREYRKKTNKDINDNNSNKEQPKNITANLFD